LQAKLLSFLDTKTFTRVGGEKLIRVDARILAATNRDLDDEVSQGLFRSDLLYRLNVFSIKVPPLRDRLEDIPALVSQHVSRLAEEMHLPQVPEIDSATLAALSRYPWPGNIRELHNVLERALILSGGTSIGPVYLAIPKASGDWSYTVRFSEDCSLDAILGDAKRFAITEALMRASGNKVQAAQLLGISRYKLNRFLKSQACL
jgi:DNA-binding NtrC family response regulator